ncbi:MAG: hypothetical protein A2887_04535 [Alphaproteobacteria bacterium RIFCSPLOWO2_01_FULL_40_26]|nr:MAG: hypothetical protein A3D15_05760 [Alphaproteobacteria bacterium RIFCSPHIGHO2_02_FULL_40_34]OFW85350.1 MAG: hypothetical protein A2794_01385 [Alphaproteobacteria bacterium RIFCSPHIGHO2_01_FULL_40_8]OFW95206.1 MAG: hypothetical protein A2887_04535 [Alphaproteobacteria bacterium RIFCSPLOWO2_01_FULL_40_26]OFX09959.1 MAG: hypothetical protein A3H30_02680 [Alphaproteobacteria bacterium RIFCSPLOWO2_02_FULL_40_19]OFX12347.1 MAG: hypothetical protein A3G22_03640 [Alphaproteobacteria bacterium RI
MREIFSKIKASFKRATKGEEALNIMIWWWGILAYAVSYFIIESLIMAINFRFIDILISAVMALYFGWHFYALKKCAPKKPKLTSEEKKKLCGQQRHEMGKKFLRKLFLQEPISKWDPVFVMLVVDVFCMAHFLGYIVSK